MTSRRLAELRLHNGTIYRWNRPIYDVVVISRTFASRIACCPPAHVVDILANAAFYYGLLRVLVEEERRCGRNVVLGR